MTGNRRHVPVRTCMGCGGRAPQEGLIRIAATAAGTLAVVRSLRGLSGRTGYLHRDPACWRAFAARKGPVRSLGRTLDRQARLACVRELEGAGSARA